MRRAVTGWLVVAVCLVLLGIGTVAGARTVGGGHLPSATIDQWRQYAADVQRGTRTPSPATTRMLTETAIAQHAYAASATQMLRFVGFGVTLLGLLLAVDLARYRARHTTGRIGGPDPASPAPPAGVDSSDEA